MIDNRSLILILTAIVIVPLAGCCPQNPPSDSVITAHGNTDWHIDTAEEFLYGTDMNGNISAANHVPGTWTRRHMHTGLTNTADFYYDGDLVGTGADADATSGIDRAMLFFYAGHGWPESWDTLGNSASQGNMSLGDCPGGGLLRYYWQCSCEVFAHGPRNCTGSPEHYGCPEDFDGSADSVAMRNVYERWGPALEPELRMACGASTLAYCHEDQTNRIWDNYNNNGFDVADSFIDGLSGVWWASSVVPLCITTGGTNASSTPLFDTVFTNVPNPSGPYFHIQYLSSFDSTAPLIFLDRPPEILAVYEIGPLPLPDPWKKIELIDAEGLLVSGDAVADRGPAQLVHPVSGSVFMRGERKAPEQQKTLSENEYLERAVDIVRSQGWLEEEITQPVGSQFRIETVQQGSDFKDRRISQKNVLIRWRRTVRAGEFDVPVLGQGGQITVQLNNDGTLLNASKVWRPIRKTRAEFQAKPYEDALNEALEQLDGGDSYLLARWTWGYKELSGNAEQTELLPYYRFMFQARDAEITRDHPPRMIEVSALGEKS